MRAYFAIPNCLLFVLFFDFFFFLIAPMYILLGLSLSPDYGTPTIDFYVDYVSVYTRSTPSTTTSQGLSPNERIVIGRERERVRKGRTQSATERAPTLERDIERE
jgi:hypothetical protein